jgi:hypothetical protein
MSTEQRGEIAIRVREVEGRLPAAGATISTTYPPRAKGDAEAASAGCGA